jgi:hypothetical protein
VHPVDAIDALTRFGWQSGGALAISPPVNLGYARLFSQAFSVDSTHDAGDFVCGVFGHARGARRAD